MEEKKEKFIELYQPFFEMAFAGRVDDLIVNVFTDHLPTHFHILKKDHYEVRIGIDDLKILSYKWQKDGEEISSKDLKKVKEWLKQKNKKKKAITNKDNIELIWDALNNKE